MLLGGLVFSYVNYHISESANDLRNRTRETYDSCVLENNPVVECTEVTRDYISPLSNSNNLAKSTSAQTVTKGKSKSLASAGLISSKLPMAC